MRAFRHVGLVLHDVACHSTRLCLPSTKRREYWARGLSGLPVRNGASSWEGTSPAAATAHVTIRRRLQLRHCHNDAPSSTTATRDLLFKPAIAPAVHGYTDIAVIGGGITGLTTAYYLSQWLPETVRIVLYEATDRTGGWIRSDFVDIDSNGGAGEAKGKGKVLFESGPRSLRMSFEANFTLDLIQRLSLQDRLLVKDKHDYAALTRYIYYPDRLIALPSVPSIKALFSLFWHNAAMRPILREVLRELRVPQRNPAVRDESVGDFFRRRFGPKIVDIAVSAFCHGVYAGDVNKLSMSALFPKLWRMEAAGCVPILTAGLRMRMAKQEMGRASDYQWMLQERGKPVEALDERIEAVRNTARLFTLKGGLEELCTSMARALDQAPNVTVHKSIKVERLSPVNANEQDKHKVGITTTNATQSTQFDAVVSTQSQASLAWQLPGAIATTQPASFSEHTAVTVMLVNLFYKATNILPVHGFGYLIPRGVTQAQNPERALGVVFDSDVFPEQDSVPGTKLTVMLGGHWWNNAAGTNIPDESQGQGLARAVLKRHLGITATPDIVRVRLQRDCIPQYPVGLKASRDRQAAWVSEQFRGALHVIGGEYSGVGMNDRVRAGYETARDIVEGVQHHQGGDEWTAVPATLSLEDRLAFVSRGE